jgi:hypothetical protein
MLPYDCYQYLHPQQQETFDGQSPTGWSYRYDITKLDHGVSLSQGSELEKQYKYNDEWLINSLASSMCS